MKYQVPVRGSRSTPDRPPTVVPPNIILCGTRCSPRNRVIRIGSRRSGAADAGGVRPPDTTTNAAEIAIILRERLIYSPEFTGRTDGEMKPRINGEVHARITARRSA